MSDDYLNAIEAETTIPALELEAAGMWQRREGGYLVVADEMVKAAITFNEESAQSLRECQCRGSHIRTESDGSGWIICERCGTPLERPDG